MSPREIYELLVGTDSRMGVGDFQDFINKKVRQNYEARDEVGAFLPEDAEEFLRELSDLVAGEDEFDDEEEEAIAEEGDDFGDEEDDEIPPIEGEVIEEVGDVRREDDALDEDDL